MRPPTAADVEPVLAAVNQRYALNIAMLTPWKRLGEAGILICLFLALRLRYKFKIYHELVLYKGLLTHSVVEDMLKIVLYLCCSFLVCVVDYLHCHSKVSRTSKIRGR